MYREPSPVFDLHEFPALRRVKPLPKRKRPAGTGNISPGGVQPGSEAAGQPDFNAHIPLEIFDEPLSATISTQQFIAQAEALTRKLSQSIYMNHLPDLAQNILESLGKAEGTPSAAQPSAGESSSCAARESHPTHEELSNAIQADIDLISEAAMQARALPAELLRNITEKLSLPNFPVSFPPPGNVDLDAIFAAGYEAGLSGLNGAGLNQYRNPIPQSRQAPFYRPQYHQSNEGPSQGTYIEAVNGDDVDGAATGPVNPPMQTRHALNGDINADMRRRNGRDEDEDDDDYGEDRQPGPNNSKKRKVPANAGISHPRGGGRGEEVEGDDGAGDPYSGKRVGVEGGHDEEGGGGSGGGGVAIQDLSVDGDAQELGLDGSGARPGIQPSFTNPQLASSRAARMPLSTLSTMTLSAPSAARVGQLNNIVKARGRLAAAMVAGLQHKEMLKARKRQLAAVMGALTQGDSVAIDQAFSMSGSGYPFGGPLGLPPSPFSKEPTPNAEGARAEGADEESSQVKTRPSKRPSARLARVAKASSPDPHRLASELPTSDFVFACPSLTTERLLATKEEVATLRSRFEAELERQAMNAAKLAAASKMIPPPDGVDPLPNATSAKSKKKDKGKSKGGNKAQPQQHPQSQPQQPAPSAPAPKGHTQQGVPPPGQTIDAAQQLPPPSKPKKKKRSALANASNPHHLRNYIPSRLPQSAGGHNPHAPVAPQTLLGPPPLKFLNADLPPPRGSKKGAAANLAASSSLGSLTGTGGEEWICLFCEYDLFYGDDSAFRRGVKNRKKVLKRRRRARERAAAAASGVKTGLKAGAAAANSNIQPADVSAAVEGDGGDDDDREGEYDGDPGYEVGGNGTDEYGNIPSHEAGGGAGGGGYHHGHVEGQIGTAG